MIEEFGPHNGWHSDGEVDLLSARILSVNGKDEEARACLLQARALALQILTDSPDNVNTIKLRGEISFDLGQLESALEDFTSVIELTPWRRSLYYNQPAFIEHKANSIWHWLTVPPLLIWIPRKATDHSGHPTSTTRRNLPRRFGRSRRPLRNSRR